MKTNPERTEAGAGPVPDPYRRMAQGLLAWGEESAADPAPVALAEPPPAAPAPPPAPRAGVDAAMGRHASTLAKALKEGPPEQARMDLIMMKAFIERLAHQIRSPLTSIKGFAETLRYGGVEGAEAERFLAIISREADCLNAVLQKLLAEFKAQIGEGEGGSHSVS